MGKQSLSKLSAYINGYMSYQIVLNTSYKISDLKENIRMLYRTVWEMSMKDILDMAADRGAYICQSQSLNLFMQTQRP